MSSDNQLLLEEDDSEQVVYESIDDYIDMQSFEHNVQPSPYVDPTAAHSPVYSNTSAAMIAATPPSQRYVPRPKPKIVPKPLQLKEALLNPPPPATPPPPDTYAPKQLVKKKPMVFKPAKKTPPIKTPPIPPARPPPTKQYTQLSPVGTAYPPAPNDYESLRPRAKQQVMKRYSPRFPPLQEKQSNIIPLQDLYDDGRQYKKRLSNTSEGGEKGEPLEEEESESTRADSPRVVCLLLTITIVALLIAVAGFIATMYSVSSVEKLKAVAVGRMQGARGCHREVMHECNSSDSVNVDTKVMCPPEIVPMEIHSNSEQSIMCEATYISQVGQEMTPSDLFVATVMKYSQNASTYIQCACFFIPNNVHPTQPTTPPTVQPPGTPLQDISNSTQPPPTEAPPTEVHVTLEEQFEAILNCTMISINCTE